MISLKTKQTQDAVEGEGEVEVEAYASVTCGRNMPIAARTNSAAGWTSWPEALRKSQEAINGLPREEDPGATYGPEFIGTSTWSSPTQVKASRPGPASSKAAQLAKNKAAQLPKGKKRRLDPSASSSDHEVEVVDESSDSASSPEDEGRKKKDGRGRPPKDPSHEGCFTAEALKAKKVFAKRLKQGRDEERALDPSAVLKYTKKVADMRYKEADLIQEYRDISSAGLGAVVTERVAMLQKMAQGCSNLKGTTVSALWNTSAHISAAAAVLNQRAQQPGHAVAEAEWEDIRKERAQQPGHAVAEAEWEDIRKKVRQLKGDLTHIKAENESIRSENENLKAKIKKLEEERSRVAARAPSPQPTPRLRRMATRPAIVESESEGENPSGVTGGKGVPRLKSPTSAAVCITCPAGKYSEVMCIARSKVPLYELAIKNLRCKRAITGALLLEVPGPEGDKLTDTLASRLRVALTGEEGVRVDRPSKKAEVRLHNLEDSVTVADIAAAVADASGGDSSDINVGDVRRAPNSLGTAWVRCPVAVAKKVAEAGRIQVGWGMSRVEVLAARPLQCFRCLEERHVRQHCRSKVDRSGLCYRCGGPGHRAAECTGRLSCPVCSTAEKVVAHRLGGGACTALQKKKGKGRKNKGAGNARTSPTSQSHQEESQQRSQENAAGSSGMGQVDPPPRARREPRGLKAETARPSAPEAPEAIMEVQMEETPPATEERGGTGEEVAPAINEVVVLEEGKSIIDLTWVNGPAVRAVGVWRVAEGIDTGCDHLYIEVILSAISPEVLRRRRERERGRPGRWALRKLDEDALKAFIAAAEWVRGDDPPRPILSPDDVEEEAEELGADMERACDASMPRVRPTPFRSAYWWTEEIAELRRSSVQARRRMQRTRRAGNVAEATTARRAFRAARKALRVAIVKAKARSWEDMLKSLDKDPWGRPYRIILQRLRSWAPPVTETLEPPLLDNVVGALFPEEGPPPLPYEGPPPDWNEEWEVSGDEMTRAARRLGEAKKAPGPDGVPGRA
ncbi:uncharacterized protein LOC116853467 [Odontomachus brunneus]|uniref:uncharacterized protein LOC116853467 n=1 Tax=Odontomachus brunneus TaxID=486640 RepID=UPI0013F24229|nr:uncharacterized protein LOC116853467 [Odontomachus brunneus]